MSNDITLGQGRKSIFKDRGIIFREFVVFWYWNALLWATCSGEKYFLNGAFWSVLTSDVIMT